MSDNEASRELSDAETGGRDKGTRKKSQCINCIGEKVQGKDRREAVRGCCVELGKV